MNVLDVAAEVLYGLVARLAVIAIGMMNIPKNREIVAGKAVEHVSESACVGVDTAGLYENTDTDALRVGNERLESRVNSILVAVNSAYDYVENASVVGNIHQRLYLIGYRAAEGYIERGIKAGNIQLHIAQSADGGSRVVFMEGTAAVNEGVKLREIVDLYAAKSHLGCHLDHFIEGKAGPTASGKGKLHYTSSS